MQDILLQASLYLVGGVIAVLIAHRLGLGSVLGYLLAGVAIAPVLEWAGSDAESLKHFVEYGVVIMLFLIGLELQPSLLWKMRGRLLGLGGLQVLITMGLVTGGALAFGIDWRQAVAIGMILSLSSTAIVLQTLGEKGWMRTEGGQSSFSVLLFQDIAVIPMLAFLPLLAAPGGFPEDAASDAAHGDGHGADHGADYAAGHGGEHAGEGGHGAVTLISELPAWGQVGAILAAVALVILAGRYLSRPAFRLIARTGQREVFVAAALGLVIVTSLLMGAVGISAALGAFLAGVVLADSEYRPELEANLEPFKGLLLGVFFITVGASADFGLLQEQTALVLGLAFGLIALKAAVLFALTPIFSLKRRDRWMFVMGLA
jgi:Kef-type K+ transport system membrane component KefB